MKKQRKWTKRLLALVLAYALFQVLRSFFWHQEWQVRRHIAEWAQRAFPDAAAKARQQYGIQAFVPAMFDTIALDVKGSEGSGDLVLIHGMDDPGIIWMNFAPVLHQKGYRVWIMVYPNDQAVTLSARMFHDEMKALFQSGVKQVTIISHSMGGLVTREMLTHPVFGFEKRATETGPKDAQTLPDIDQVIMIAPPNKGAWLARFRIILEVKDYVYHVMMNGAPALNGIFDGAGEAGIDLIPESRFLETLNQRPWPDGVGVRIIAGRLLPDVLPTGLTSRIGDGLVPVSSTQFGPNAPVIIARAGHLTMVRNIFAHSRHVPQSLPVVLDMLASGND